jgi:hypothetical protein
VYLEYRIETYHDSERLEFSWEGTDEMDPLSGRGWAVIQNGQLQGRLFFHEGDDSRFTRVLPSYYTDSCGNSSVFPRYFRQFST